MKIEINKEKMKSSWASVKSGVLRTVPKITAECIELGKDMASAIEKERNLIKERKND